MEHGDRRTRPARARPFGRRADDRVELTARQQEVLDRVSLGLENKEIAGELRISEQAVKQQVSVLLKKFAVPSRAMLVQQSMAVRLVGRPIDASDAPLEHFFERAPMLMAFSRGPRHELRLVNREFRRVFGERDYVGRPLSECFPRIQPALLEVLDRVFADGAVWRTNDQHLSVTQPDGSARQVVLSLVAEPVRRADGGIVGIAFYASDLTEMLEARRSLREPPGSSEDPGEDLVG